MGSCPSEFFCSVAHPKDKTQKKRTVPWASNRLHFRGPSFDVPSLGFLFSRKRRPNWQKNTPKACLLKKILSYARIDPGSSEVSIPLA